MVPSISGTLMKITMQNIAVRIAGAQSTPRSQQTSTNSLSSSTSPDPNLASLLLRKTRSLCDVNNEDPTNSFLVFSLFSQIDDP
jgi:hypothetical protein